jgi:hypothetical protein
MATINLSDPTLLATGVSLYDDPTGFRAKDNALDNMPGGTYSHLALECSATEVSEWIALWQHLIAVCKAGGKVPVINKTGSSIPAGPVSVTGYDSTSGHLKIVLASSKLASLITTAAIADQAEGSGYITAEFTGSLDLTGVTIGDPVYLHDDGTYSLTDNSTYATQVIGYTVDQVNKIQGIIKQPTKFSASFIGTASVDYTKLIADNASGANKMVAMNATGTSLTFVDGPPGDITSIVTATGSGLTGGTTSGAATLAVDPDGSTIEVSVGNKVQLKALGIMDSHVNASAAIAWSKISKSGAAPGDVGAAATSHNHAGADINSGTIDRARLPGVTIVGMSGDATPATTDKHKNYANLGASLRTVTLPEAAEGEGPFWGYVGHSDGVRFAAAAGDRLRVGANVTTADTGHVDSTTVGSAIEFIAIDATNWVARTVTGTWAVTAS